MAKIRRSFSLFCLVCWVGAPASGDDVQVNTYTTGVQLQASLALNDHGEFVVVWASEYSAGDDSTSIQGQRHTSDGAPVGGEFQVNTLTTFNQLNPAVAIGSDGRFLVVWASDNAGSGIRGQRFAPDGSAVGDEFQINTYSGVNHSFPATAMAPNGEFVVLWRGSGSVGNDSSGYSIQGRHYAADGSPLGPQYQVNTYTTDDQSAPAVVVGPEGDVVAVWESDGSVDSTTDRIHGQRYHSDGSPAGDEFQVGSVESGSLQFRPDVAKDAEGAFVVVWETADAADRHKVRAQRYASDGTPVASEFQVTSEGREFEFFEPSVASGANGDFIIVWQRQVEGRSVIQGQRFAANGSAVDATFQVNTNPIGSHRSASVSATGVGEFLVAWDGFETGGNDPDRSIERSDFFLLNPLIFGDGFESGDTSAWSHTQP